MPVSSSCPVGNADRRTAARALPRTVARGHHRLLGRLLALALGLLAGGTPVLAQPTPTPAPTPLCAADQYYYFFRNYCSDTVWLGVRNTSDPTSYPPRDGSWAIAPSCRSNSDCPSGTCDIDSERCTCTQASDCGGGLCAADGQCHVWMNLCLPQSWTSGAIWPRTQCVPNPNPSATPPATLTCQTGGCYATDNSGNQLLDCSVSNGGGSPTSPVTQVEVTSTSSSINYDVSLVAGYNVETRVAPVGGSWVPPWSSPPTATTCLTMGCTSDLNATCPSTLQYTGTGTDVIGCMDPCDQCGVAGEQIHCNTVRSETWTGCLPTPTPATTPSGGPTPTPASGSVTYGDLYCAKNAADGNAMASANQGTPTAFGQIDCLQGTTFVRPTFATDYTLPAGMGVCLSVNAGLAPHYNDFGWANTTGGTSNCGGLPPPASPAYQPLADGTACGGYLGAAADYSGALGYTCQTATYTDAAHMTQVAHLCLPPTTTGIGQCTLDGDGGVSLYNSAAGVTNPSWVDAAMTAANGMIPGSGTPFYQTFKTACPGAYAWQYDDASAGVACTTDQGPAFRGVQTLFCLSQSSQESVEGALPPPPPSEIVKLDLEGFAVKAGAPGARGAVRLRGSFTPRDPIALDQIQLDVSDLIDESGGAGELLARAGSAQTNASTGLPALHVVGSASPRHVVFATAPGVEPRIWVELRRPSVKHRRATSSGLGEAGVAPLAASAVEVEIRAGRGVIAAPQRCSASSAGPHTLINTALRIDLVGGRQTLLVGTTVPWDCLADGIIARRR